MSIVQGMVYFRSDDGSHDLNARQIVKCQLSFAKQVLLPSHFINHMIGAQGHCVSYAKDVLMGNRHFTIYLVPFSGIKGEK